MTKEEAVDCLMYTGLFSNRNAGYQVINLLEGLGMLPPANYCASGISQYAWEINNPERKHFVPVPKHLRKEDNNGT